jgi:outer membrane protein assembly factor BamB
MIADPSKRGTIIFWFVPPDKKGVTVEGNPWSVFRADTHTLFFAHYSPVDCGCVVAAYDLDTGNEIWRTPLEGGGKVPPHSAYRNRVTMYYWHTEGKEDEQIYITGHESNGDYVERLDRKTGRQLAPRAYTNGLKQDGGESHSASSLPKDTLGQGGQDWQRILNNTPFHFKKAEADAMFSLARFAGNCQVDVMWDWSDLWRYTFTFARAGKKILVLKGHHGSVFQELHGTLYFAHYNMSSDGCTVVAYDLNDGRELWRIELEAVGRVQHFGYRNTVTLDVGSFGKGQDVVYIVGSESYGDYAEVLDAKSGKRLAHRVYRQGYRRAGDRGQ